MLRPLQPKGQVQGHQPGITLHQRIASLILEHLPVAEHGQGHLSVAATADSYYPPQISWSNPRAYLSSSTKAKRSSSAKFLVVFIKLFAVTPASLMRLMVHSPTVASAAKHHGINAGLPATTQHPGQSNWPPCVHGQPLPTPPSLL